MFVLGKSRVPSRRCFQFSQPYFPTIYSFIEQQNAEDSSEEPAEVEPHSYSEETDNDVYYSQDSSDGSSVGERDDASANDENDLRERDNEELDADPEIEQLREWAIESGTCQIHLDKLLSILRVRFLPSLPKSSKTFLKTSKARYDIIDMEDHNGKMGQFIYFGIASGLNQCINANIHIGKIEIKVDADGLPLARSSNKQFWVLAGKVHYIPDIYELFPIAIFFGESKPRSSQVYLDQFVAELNDLQRYGIVISNRHFEVNLKCFICDTPARAFLKNTLGHGGLHACERCTVVGERHERRTVYPSTVSEERTDASFRRMQQPELHINEPSPVLQIIPRINVVACFVLDFMHLCCLGIMKKLLEYWLTGSLNFRLDRRSREELARRMVALYSQVPFEFQRKPRSTQYFAKWKATEFRFFLLYCGPIVLKHLIRVQLYNHFMLLHVGCRVLCSEKLCHRHVYFAKQYLTTFFIALKDYYGVASQILNAHHLIHLADDVINMGCSLLHLTAFPFESMLGKLKKCLRTPHRQLAQLCRRLYEGKGIRAKNIPQLPPMYAILKSTHNCIKQIRFKHFLISTSYPDNVVILQDETIVSINKIVQCPDGLRIEGQIWDKKKSIFNYPCDSAVLQMWELKDVPRHGGVSHMISDIDSKIVRLSLSLCENSPQRIFVIPFLH